MHHRFAFLADGSASQDLLSCLEAHLGTDCVLDPVYTPSHAALYELVQSGEPVFAWCPPIVARDLARFEGARLIATVLRGATATYYAAITALASSSITRVEHLREARVGWVSRASAAGYVVPRAYLVSLGLPLRFGSEHLYGTHARAVAALGRGEVDAIATYTVMQSGAFSVPHVPGGRVLATAGPIPGEVIVASRQVPVRASEAMASRLRARVLPPGSALTRRLAVTGFGLVTDPLLASLGRWKSRSDEHVSRSHAPG